MDLINTLAVPCTIVRGGTSRGLFFLDSDLPADTELRYQILLNVAGAQDASRIDGLAGQLSHNSKIGIIKKSNRPGINLEFQFGQVHLTKNTIDFDGTCGNVISAVGIYALHKQLIHASNSQTELTITILDTNTQTIAKMTLPVSQGKYDCSQQFFIPGVNHPSGKVTLDYADTVNSNAEIFTTGNKVDIIKLSSDLKIPVTITNILGLYVFVKYSDFVSDDAVLPIDDKSNAFMQRFKELRGKAAVLAGILKDWQDVDERQPVVPRIVFMLDSYKTFELNIKMLTSNKVHSSIAGSAAVSLAAATQIEHTIPFNLFDNKSDDINIKHPSGTITLKSYCENRQFKKLCIERNARIMMDGVVYVTSYSNQLKMRSKL